MVILPPLPPRFFLVTAANSTSVNKQKKARSWLLCLSPFLHPRTQYPKIFLGQASAAISSHHFGWNHPCLGTDDCNSKLISFSISLSSYNLSTSSQTGLSSYVAISILSSKIFNDLIFAVALSLNSLSWPSTICFQTATQPYVSDSCTVDLLVKQVILSMVSHTLPFHASDFTRFCHSLFKSLSTFFWGLYSISFLLSSPTFPVIMITSSSEQFEQPHVELSYWIILIFEIFGILKYVRNREAGL